MEAYGLSAQRWWEYVEVMSELHRLDLSRESKLEVVQNLQRIEVIVGPLLALPLPDGSEPAPVFQP